MMKIRKNPIRTYPKLCLYCSKPNPVKRNYCSDKCLFSMRKQTKKTPKIYIKKPRKKLKKKLKKINPFIVEKIKCSECRLYATSSFNGKVYCVSHNPKRLK